MSEKSLEDQKYLNLHLMSFQINCDLMTLPDTQMIFCLYTNISYVYKLIQCVHEVFKTK